MPYTKERLQEALRVIKEDDKIRHALQAAKISRTQYRDSFDLRRKSSNILNAAYIWRDGDNDSSDDDFDPDSKRKPRKVHKSNEHDEETDKGRKGNSKKRGATDVFSDIEQSNDDPAKRQKTNDESLGTIPIPPSASFITFKFTTKEGHHVLTTKLKEHGEHHIDIYQIRQQKFDATRESEWRSSSGDLHRVSETDWALEDDFRRGRKDFEPPMEIEQLQLAAPRTLRSGRILAESIPKKKTKKKMESSSMEIDLDVGANNNGETGYDKSRSPLKSYTTPSQELKPLRSRPGLRTGKSTEDAISISSSSDKGSVVTTPPTSPLVTPQQDLCRLPALTSPSRPPRLSLTPAAISSGARSKIVTRTTHFSHPINFHPSHPDQCTFHKDYRHPVIGHKATTGQYLVYSDKPSQLMELGKGHGAKNVPGDIMCHGCARSYIRIIQCPGHTFRRVPHTAERAFILRDHGTHYLRDMFGAALDGLTRNLNAPTEICNLCPVPASWRCHNDDPNSRSGCGLHLCTACHELVMTTTTSVPSPGGQLVTGLQDPGSRQKILGVVGGHGMGTRADAEFCFKGGLVWSAYFVDV